MLILDILPKLWQKLNLRSIIILSLSIQVLLVILAPIRKRGAHRMIIMLTWLAYLVADWAADYAFGLLSKSQLRVSQGSAAEAYADLYAFWAPFLLVHLGGPDTITAFALEDNELWRRHLLNLLFQLGAAGYVFYQSLPVNKLIVPTVLMFIDGLIKYIERTCALFAASFSKFRDSMLKPDPGPNYVKLMEEYHSKKEANIPARIVTVPKPIGTEPIGTEPISVVLTELNDIAVIKTAYQYFRTFKGLLVDQIFSIPQRDETRNFFSKIAPKVAFKVIEVELNFIYDVLYTKAAIIHSWKGYFSRATSFMCSLTALAFFCFSPKHDLHGYDIMITYTLLIGAISLDTVALIMLIFSNWMVATVRENSFIKKIFVKPFLMFEPETSVFGKWILRARSSRTVSHYNLLDQCLKKPPTLVDKLISHLHVEEFMENLKPGQGSPLSETLCDLIFKEVNQKADQAKHLEDLKRICAVRGEWVLQKCEKLLPFVKKVDYGESLLLWHIATDLCYNTDIPGTSEVCYKTKDKENSKTLSEYMLYLLIKQPDMMSMVSGIGQQRFMDTCEETKKFLNERLQREKRDKITACQELLSVPTAVAPTVKGDRSKSVLFDACILAKYLQDSGECKWKIMSKVWVELLAYAASHCRPYNHAQQLSKGGELVSLVWLLMFQLGLSEQFQITEDHATAKLIVDKSAPST